MPDLPASSREIDRTAETISRLIAEVERVVVGQRHLVERLVISLITGGHVLIEGVPGLAKTLTVHTLAHAIKAKFSRIQFTPDLLPADLVGTLIYNPRVATFTPRKGPVFANIVLADEVNRAPAKVQSALLEAMQERRVTIGDTTYALDDPFLVLATQNPIEQEGTYSLPEAQVDRFMFKLVVTYPSRAEERAIIDRMGQSRPETRVDSVIDLDQVRAARALVDQVRLDDRIKDYIVEVVRATRNPRDHGLDLARFVEFGASPRAGINLAIAARAHALLQGRAFVTPADVKAIGLDVMRHRVIASYEAQAEEMSAEQIVQKVFDHVPVP
ncbi:MAG: MoxR family ATPase [Phycisphaerales bacterium]